MNQFGLKETVLDFIMNASRDLGMDEVILFGSRATGRYVEKSDIDLAISGARRRDFQELLDEKCPTLLQFDFVDLSQELNPGFRSRIDSEGVKLYG